MEILRAMGELIAAVVIVVCLLAIPFLFIYFVLWIVTTFWITILALVGVIVLIVIFIDQK